MAKPEQKLSGCSFQCGPQLRTVLYKNCLHGAIYLVTLDTELVHMHNESANLQTEPNKYSVVTASNIQRESKLD